MPPIDKLEPQLSPSFVSQVLEDHGKNTANFNEETAALFNASIVASPMSSPQSCNVATILNTEMHFHWARDRGGDNANHDRVEQLKAMGWDFATTKDVVMSVKSTVKGENEIRNGDLVLMKCKKEAWLALRKAQQMEAIGQFSPRRSPDVDNVMRSAKLLTDESVMQEFAGRRVVSDPRLEVADQVVRGNTARVQKGA